jgi:hypothetical protein
VRALAIIGLLTMALLVALGTVETAQFGPVAVILVAALALAVLSPDIVERVWVRGIGVKTALVEFTLPPEPPKPVEGDVGDVQSVVQLQLQLQGRLAYVAKHMLNPEDLPEYATVGSLWIDKLLTSKDAEAAQRLLTVTDEIVAVWPEKTRETFLEESNKLVSRFRWNVLDQQMRKAIPKGWDRAERDRRSARPDLYLETGNTRVRLRSVFVESNPEHARLRHSVTSLAKARGETDREQIAVVQNNVSDDRISALGDLPDGVRVVRARELNAVLVRLAAGQVE